MTHPSPGLPRRFGSLHPDGSAGWSGHSCTGLRGEPRPAQPFRTGQRPNCKARAASCGRAAGHSGFSNSASFYPSCPQPEPSRRGPGSSALASATPTRLGPHALAAPRLGPERGRQCRRLQRGGRGGCGEPAGAPRGRTRKNRPGAQARPPGSHRLGLPRSLPRQPRPSTLVPAGAHETAWGPWGKRRRARGRPPTPIPADIHTPRPVPASPGGARERHEQEAFPQRRGRGATHTPELAGEQPARSPGRPAVTDLRLRARRLRAGAPRAAAGRGQALRRPRALRAGRRRRGGRAAEAPARARAALSPLPVAARGPPPRSGSPWSRPEQGRKSVARAGEPHRAGTEAAEPPQRRRRLSLQDGRSRGGGGSAPLPIPVRRALGRPL